MMDAFISTTGLSHLKVLLIANNTLRGSDQRTNQILAHRADVNTVCFVDDNTNVLASGADDGIVKVISAPDIP